MTGKLYIICAPSGTGKTSLVDKLIKILPNLEVSISHTTRAMRSGEKNNTNYHFITIPEFKKLIEENAFLEYATVFDNFYGTSRHWVENKLADNIDVILEIDWQGAAQIRKLFPHTISIFIFPPSIEILSQRLRDRGQDHESVIAKRLNEARHEMSHFEEFDYLVINDNFDAAVSDLKAIILSQRLKVNIQKKKYKDLIKKLL